MVGDMLVTLMPGRVTFLVCAPGALISDAEKRHEKNNCYQTRGNATLCAAAIGACAATDKR